MFSFRTRLQPWCLALCTATACAMLPVQAQPAGSYEPTRGQAGKDVIWIPTPDAAVDRMLQMAEVRESDRVVDLGSGDGKIAIAAGRQYGAQALGLEYNPDMVVLSKRRAQEAGVAAKVDFRQADIFATDFSQANVVTMYLLPELNLRLRPLLFRMVPGTRVVSHSFTMGHWEPDETSSTDTATLYLWRVPANASGTWKVRGAADGAPAQSLLLSQRFQMVEGEARVGRLRTSLVRPHLSGDVLSFGLRDASGALQQVQARVSGNRMRGTTTAAGGSTRPFEAERVGEARDIEGVAANPAEIQLAQQALN